MNTRAFICLRAPSVKKWIPLRKYPRSIIKNMGATALRDTIKLSIASIPFLCSSLRYTRFSGNAQERRQEKRGRR